MRCFGTGLKSKGFDLDSLPSILHLIPYYLCILCSDGTWWNKKMHCILVNGLLQSTMVVLYIYVWFQPVVASRLIVELLKFQTASKSSNCINMSTTKLPSILKHKIYIYEYPRRLYMNIITLLVSRSKHCITAKSPGSIVDYHT